jgi:hypothetical protein
MLVGVIAAAQPVLVKLTRVRHAAGVSRHILLMALPYQENQ